MEKCSASWLLIRWSLLFKNRSKRRTDELNACGGQPRWRFRFCCKSGTAIRVCSEKQAKCKRQTALVGSMCKTSRYGSHRLSLHGARLGRGACYVHRCDAVRGFALAAICLHPFDLALLVHLLVAEFCKMSASVHVHLIRFILV